MASERRKRRCNLNEEKARHNGTEGDWENKGETAVGPVATPKMSDFPPPPKVAYVRDNATKGTIGIKVKGSFSGL